jgi:phosphatidylglycerol:prolipoprotein diacylglycerol transferase
VFPGGGPEPRHPSQLYEALAEGLILFLVMIWFNHRTEWRRQPGRIGGVFLCGYAVARMSGELFREPDSYLGFILGPTTMGQLLSLPMLLGGAYLIVAGTKRTPLPDRVK